MSPKLTPSERTALIERALKGEPVSKICKEAGISRVIFYRWLNRYEETGEKGLAPGEAGRPHAYLGPKHPKHHSLSPLSRSKMIEEVVLQGSNPSQVAEKYGVSRVTLYKWLNRYKRAQEVGREETFVSQKPQVEHYFRQTPEKYEEVILALVAKHPEYGVRRLVSNVPKIGETPIVGHHGIQNILRRHDLSTFEERLVYAQSQITPVTKAIDRILAPVADFFRIEPQLRGRVVRFAGVFALSVFVTIVAFGLGSVVTRSFVSAEGASKIGLVFAYLALSMGSIFFLYSFKYYLTLALVLSFSQQGTQGVSGEETGDLRQKGFLAWLLGIGRSLRRKSSSKGGPIGLEPNLEHISLKRYPLISVQIPFYNEKNVVARAIEAVTSFDYKGEYEVILADDSTDETTGIIHDHQIRYLAKGEKLKETKGEDWTLSEVEVRPGVVLKHLHRTSRSGFKGGALNLALKVTNPEAEFISVFDADFVPYPDTLTLFVKYFKLQEPSEDYQKSKVAAVQGYQWHVLNKSENWVTRGVRSEYAGSYVIERSGIEVYGGLKQISGSVYMIRKDVLSEVGWGTSITEDFELTLKLYEKGYKVVYTPYIQAPAECVSTIKRLIRQRMRWAEGHSNNVRRMFRRLLFNNELSVSEKAEFIYLSPYYLQAFFFVIGTLSWLISEAVFPARLPFWTSLWGWSLVLTNMLSLPLMNAVGLFLEESDERDYLGLASFVALSYLLVPFQAYAAVKGFLERSEGPWFRTPKTGRITDLFARGQFYRFISGILPGLKPGVAPNQTASFDTGGYLALASANNRFDKFAITPAAVRRGLTWASKAALSILLAITTTLFYFSRNVQMVYATNITGNQKLGALPGNSAGEIWPAWGNFLQNTTSYASGSNLFTFNNTCCNVGSNNFKWYTNTLPITPDGTAIIPAGAYSLNLVKALGPRPSNRLNYAIQILLTSNDGATENVILSNTTYWLNNTTGDPMTTSQDNTVVTHPIGTLGANISVTSPVNRLAVRLYIIAVTHNTRTNITWIINNTSTQAALIIPAAIQVPEIPKAVIYVVLITIMPAIPIFAQIRIERKKKGLRGKGWKDDFKELINRLTGRKEFVLDKLPV